MGTHIYLWVSGFVAGIALFAFMNGDVIWGAALAAMSCFDFFVWRCHQSGHAAV